MSCRIPTFSFHEGRKFVDRSIFFPQKLLTLTESSKSLVTNHSKETIIFFACYLANRNTQIYNLSSGLHITHFFTVVAKKRKHFETSKSRQQMITVNLLQKNFKQLSYYAGSNWYYILIQLLSITESSII